MLTAFPCDQTTEYDNRIEEEIDIVEPEDEEEDLQSARKRGQVEQQLRGTSAATGLAGSGI